MPDSSITKHLAYLPHLSKPALCDLWRQLFKRDPPEIRKDLMLHIVSHRLQEQEFGGLSDAGDRRLRQLATIRGRPQRSRFKPTTHQTRNSPGAPVEKF